MATTSVNKIGPDLGNEILNSASATRFLVVRHPLLRFFSGFRQKFKRNDPLHKKDNYQTVYTTVFRDLLIQILIISKSF